MVIKEKKMNREDMKNKYSSFITEVSEILGLGKPVDILKLCATTDLFFQPLEKQIEELEAKIKHLTEHLEPQTASALFEQVEEEVRQEQRIKELESQIEKMKCCENCNNFMHRIDHRCNTKCKNFSEWEIKENE